MDNMTTYDKEGKDHAFSTGAGDHPADASKGNQPQGDLQAAQHSKKSCLPPMSMTKRQKEMLSGVKPCRATRILTTSAPVPHIIPAPQAAVSANPETKNEIEMGVWKCPRITLSTCPCITTHISHSREASRS